MSSTCQRSYFDNSSTLNAHPLRRRIRGVLGPPLLPVFSADNAHILLTLIRCVLYSANPGDAHEVLCHAGKVVCLTYDHKGSDKQPSSNLLCEPPLLTLYERIAPPAS